MIYSIWEGQRANVIACLIVASFLAGIHILMTWGYITPFMGDYGVYLNQVERAINGETVYLDFYYVTAVFKHSQLIGLHIQS